MAICGELPLSEGGIVCGGKISYTAQQAWVFSTSIRQNILFGQEYEEEKYQHVIRACCLEKVSHRNHKRCISLAMDNDILCIGNVIHKPIACYFIDSNITLASGGDTCKSVCYLTLEFEVQLGYMSLAMNNDIVYR